MVSAQLRLFGRPRRRNLAFAPATAGAVATAVVLAATLAMIVQVTPGAARVVVPADDPPADAQFLFARLSHAFRVGDYEALVSYLHPDGVQVGLGPTADRASLMTPAQAHYYFKNLFQARRTMSFNFLKQHQSGQDRLHAIAVWRWERTDGGPPVNQRLLFAMIQAGGYWRVTEITAVRGG